MLDRENIGTFKYIFRTDFIVDFFDGAEIVEQAEERWKVIKNMPVMPRDYEVYRIYFPDEPGAGGEMVPIYMCAGERGGALYFFCNFNFLEIVSDYMYLFEGN